MVVASIKCCWSKFSARIRDYYWDTVDLYQRPGEQATGEPRTKANCNKQKSHRHHHHHHHHHHHTCEAGQANKESPRCTRNPSKSATTTSGHNRSPAGNHQTQSISHHHHDSSSLATLNNNNNNNNNNNPRSTAIPITKNPTNIPLSKRVLPRGFSKKITSQGQVFFCDQNGHKYWYDPSVPKELISASLDLDNLIGELSNNWEIRQTVSGKVYYVNHIKKTTQFTDPRLVAYKDHLWRHLERQHYFGLHKQAVTYSKQLRKNQIPMLERGPVPNPESIIAKYSGNCVNHNISHTLPNRSGAFHYDADASREDSNSSRHRCSAVYRNCDNFSPFVDRLCDENQLPRPAATSHLNNYSNLLSSSHHNLSVSTNDTTVTNHSNTLTGPLPTWFRPRFIAETRSNNQSTANNQQNINPSQSFTVAKTSSTSAREQNVQNSNNIFPTNLSPYSPNNNNNIYNSNSLGRINQQDATHQQQQTRNNKELFDKISILRQELLKQQVVGHPCRVDISRKRIFEDSFRVVSQMQTLDLKKRLLIKFKGEEGLDYGGIAREWFYLLSREMLNPIHGLFQYTSDDIYNLQINPDSGIVYREHLSYLHFCGRVIGMAVFHGHFIEGHFTLPFYKMLLRKPITLADIELVDPELFRSLCWILENDITNVIDTTFLVQHNALGQLQEHELKEGGRNLVVNEDNKHEYVSLYVNYRCRRGIEHQFEALQRGFYELLPATLVESFDEYELELLIGGLSKINIDDWRLHTKLKNCTIESPLVKWFWEIVKSYGEDKRARLLQFVTGSPRVPIQGFKALQGVNSELRLFTIHLIKNASTDNLPKSHTCFNRIDLPPYESYEKLRDKLTQAIEETIGFAMQ